MPIQLDRRRFLATLSISAAAFALPACRGDTDQARSAGIPLPTGPLPADRERFPQSVASGDPRPDRILLWTRVASDQPHQMLWLQVAEDAQFSRIQVQRELATEAAHDHCVRIRLTDLAPRQTLHYRFLVQTPEGWRASPAGRTRTAPAADAEVPLRFAFMSCQDYGGRWYNSLLPLLEEELDFVLHLGDFIYETVGDPGFQSSGGERRIVFEDQEGAIRLGSEDAPYFAASSLSNYRQLHRTFRTDPVLQALLERAPLVTIWDDHEFADDCWQANATHHDARRDEADGERRRNAEQAYLEYLPLDPGDADGHLPREALFPNLRIWRQLRFGRNLDLFLTDTRSERPDHLIPEDAFPGEVIYDEAALRDLLPKLGMDPEAVLAGLFPYVDLDTAPFSALRPALTAALGVGYAREGLAAEAANARAARAAQGKIAWPVLEALIGQWNANAPAAMQAGLPPLPAAAPRGLCWAALGKTALFSSTGSRYFVTAEGYGLYAALRALDEVPHPMSRAQRDWLVAGLMASDARWKVVASSISMTPIVLDLARPELDAPALMRRRFLLNVDQWDGFPQARGELLDAFDAAGGAVVLSGDIHAAFVSQHTPRTVEFTVPAVSSKTIADILAGEVEKDSATAETGRRLVAGLDDLIRSGDPVLRHAETRVHGFGLASLDAAGFQVAMPVLPSEVCLERGYDTPEAVAARGGTRHFSVDAASRTLAGPAARQGDAT